jgi:ABC-type antimicrobial peptide transport system permease subunit
MISKLTFHNIRIAWRNLMKYKVQNIISVLCLAVGLVCFSVGFIIAQRALERRLRGDGNPRRQYACIYDTKGDSVVYVGPKTLKRINDKHLSSIDHIELDYSLVLYAGRFFDLEGKKHTVTTYLKLITPERLHDLGVRSAITGKRIPVLKPGDILMTKGMQERTFGLDVNPIGYATDDVREHMFSDNRTRTIYSEPQDTTTAYGKIIDVVDTGDWMLTENYLLVVTDLLQEFNNRPRPWHNYEKKFSFILAKGKTTDDLLKELYEAFPEYEVSIEGSKGLRTDILTIIGLMTILSSILLIGLFGFLKMQIQLFRLRQREMGLRQCMGAQRGQLMSLMMWEVAIVFFFVTLLTLGLTYLLAAYALPIILKIAPELSFNMPLTYTTELWICLVVFLLTIVIALLSVRQVVTKPLNEVVGRSHRTSTKGRNLLISLQMVFCITFLLWASIFSIALFNKAEELPKPVNKDEFRNCIVSDMHEWNIMLLDSLPYYQHVTNFTSVVTLPLRQDLKDGEMPPGRHWEQKDKETNQRFYTYQALLTDEHLFEMLDLDVQPTATKEEIVNMDMIPIYVATERAAQLREKLGVKSPTNPKTRIIEKGKEAECVGYFRGKMFTSLTWDDFAPVFLYVTERSYFADYRYIDFRVPDDYEDANTGWSLHHYVLVQSKAGQYDAAVKELTAGFKELGVYTVSKPPLDRLYDVCFKDLRMAEMAMQILAILNAIALLCIVLTLFSSVSLDVRGRQKEVAIRKAHGASQGQIIWLFGRGYVYCLLISSVISLLLFYGINILFAGKLVYADTDEMFKFSALPALFSIGVVALVTLLTVGYKIYKVSKLEPASIIKKE